MSNNFNPVAVGRMSPSERIARGSVPEPNTGCWLWTMETDDDGYGIIKIGGRRRFAHRVSYEAHNGALVDGLTIDHLCRQECCVNPSHLEQVTNRINTLRGDTLQARNAAKTHCDHGHEFNKENTAYEERNGRSYRVCRECRRRRGREQYARRAAR